TGTDLRRPNHRQMRQRSLLTPRDNLQIDPRALFDPRDEVAAVFGVAQRRGCRRHYSLTPEFAGASGKLDDGLQGQGRRMGIQPTVMVDPATQPRYSRQLQQRMRFAIAACFDGEHQYRVGSNVKGRQLHVSSRIGDWAHAGCRGPSIWLAAIQASMARSARSPIASFF